MLYSPLHPIRCFQLDGQLNKKLDHLREQRADSLKARQSGLDGPALAVSSSLMNLPDAAFESFENFQSCAFKCFQAQEEHFQFLMFWDGPRQIFSFDRDLSAALAHTDCGEVPWDMIVLPYDEFYIHFGTVLDTDLRIMDRSYAPDGAYVRRQGGISAVLGFGGPDTLHVKLTTALVSHTYDDVLRDYPTGTMLCEPVCNIVLCGKPGQTVQDAFNQGNEANLSFARQRDDLLFQSCLDYARETGVSTEGAQRIPAHESNFLRGADMMAACLPLLVNCIAYLTHVELPDQAEYPPETPPKLLAKIERAPGPRRRDVLRKQLEQRGYTKVRFVRHEGLEGLSEGHVPTGKTLRPHWRRGHWRLQHCGPENSRLRMCWVKPTLVNAEKGNPTAGHVYQVKE